MSDVYYIPGHGYKVHLSVYDNPRHGDCRDCVHLYGFVNWWCGNSKAIDDYGTSIPGRTDCKFWDSAPIINEKPIFSFTITAKKLFEWRKHDRN